MISNLLTVSSNSFDQKILNLESKGKEVEEKANALTSLLFSMVVKEMLPKEHGIMGSGEMGGMFNAELAHTLSEKVGSQCIPIAPELMNHLIKMQNS